MFQSQTLPLEASRAPSFREGAEAIRCEANNRTKARPDRVPEIPMTPAQLLDGGAKELPTERHTFMQGIGLIEIGAGM